MARLIDVVQAARACVERVTPAGVHPPHSLRTESTGLVRLAAASTLALPDPRTEDEPFALQVEYGGTLRAAGLTAASLFVLTILWASYAPISAPVIVPGAIVVEESRQMVAHADGGIVRRIDVRDGSVVRRGDPLVELDGAQLATEYESAQAQAASEVATIGRLRAELAGDDEMFIPVEASELGVSLSKGTRVWESAGAQLRSARAEIGSKVAALEVTVREGLAMQPLLNEQLRQVEARLQIALEDLHNSELLLASGAASKLRLSQAKATVATMRGERAEASARAIDNYYRTARAQSEINQTRSTRQNQATQELSAAERNLLESKRRMDLLRQQTARLTIRAPVDGRVIDLGVHTVGSPISPNVGLMEIVPDGKATFVDAQIAPSEVGSKRVGTSVRCRILLPGGKSEFVNGTVSDISADRIVDRQRGNSYFTIRVALNSLGETLGDLVRPGIPVELIFLNEGGTVIGQYVRPLFDLFLSPQASTATAH